MKKLLVLSVSLLIALVLVPTFTIIAQEDDSTSDIDTIISEYNLIPVDAVPYGIEPIIVQDEAHLREVMNQLSNPVITYSQPSLIGLSRYNVMSMTGMNPVNRSCSVNTGFSWFQHDATFYFNLAIPTRVSSVWSRVSHLGITGGVSMSDTSTNWWYTNSNQTSARARGEATMSNYIFLREFVYLSSYRVACEVSYP